MKRRMSLLLYLNMLPLFGKIVGIIKKTGYLYPFRSYPVAQEYQQEIKEKKAMEFEGMGSIAGGWTVYVYIVQLKCSR